VIGLSARTATDQRTPGDRLAAGHDALAQGAWSEARDHFEAAVGLEESAEALEGLGWSGWWLADPELTLGARERAFRAYRAAGDVASAGRVAAWLAADHLEFRGDDAVARGWLERAHRLLDGIPEGADHGWLALNEGSYSLNVGEDPDEAARHAQHAAALGRKFAVADLEAVGLALEGITLVLRGRVEDGLRQLDEASAIATGEQLQLPLSLGWALCYAITACEGVGDFPRAAQWCEALREFAERWGGRQLLGVCRSAYGAVLTARGEWAKAEAELNSAVADLDAARPGMAAAGLVRLAQLRARQGRTDEARALFERAGAHRAAVLGLGALALAEGDPATAADAAERILRRLPASSSLARVPALELLVRARAESGEFEDAAAAQAELERAGSALGTPYLLGRAHHVAGELAAKRGDLDQARRAYEDAIDRFEDGGAPYDAARAQVGLAEVLAALGRDKAAAAEARAAESRLAALGAPATPAGSADAARRALTDLTPRELEVLRLVAQGLADAEIAERLVLSPHTVHRHVANIRAKLRLPSRAAAVAYAARSGLL
jgi:ATP/maltotriose-dependent transcriptional regulator MalT